MNLVGVGAVVVLFWISHLFVFFWIHFLKNPSVEFLVILWWTLVTDLRSLEAIAAEGAEEVNRTDGRDGEREGISCI